MVTREAATLMKEALSPQGVILVNVLASLEGHSSRFYKTLYATYSEVFDHIDLYAVQDPGDSHRRQNIILVAGNSLVQQQFASDEIQKMLAHAIPKPQGDFYHSPMSLPRLTGISRKCRIPWPYSSAGMRHYFLQDALSINEAMLIDRDEDEQPATLRPPKSARPYVVHRLAGIDDRLP